MVIFYAIKTGINPGIYLTWEECENNIKFFINAKYKKFSSKNEALNYINDTNDSTKKIKLNTCKSLKIKNISKNNNMHIVDDNYNFEKCINVYTDGSCINNGRPNAIAGYGIFFAKDDKRNVSLKLKRKNNYNLTNNRAELKAILHTFKLLKLEIEENKIIVIHTDSKYSIISFTSNNLSKKEPKDIPNYDYVCKGNNLCKKYPNIKFHHIKSHTGKQDIHSIGNENADRLATISLNKNNTDIIMTFGKYKNKTLDQIYQLDKNYLLWCVNSFTTQCNDIKLFLEKK